MKEYIVEYETEQIENSTFFYGGKIKRKLIRCKDCKWYDISENGVNGICRNLIVPFDSYEWCSRAEPKEK